MRRLLLPLLLVALSACAAQRPQAVTVLPPAPDGIVPLTVEQHEQITE
jgi:hypothetical protein